MQHRPIKQDKIGCLLGVLMVGLSMALVVMLTYLFFSWVWP